MEAALWMAEKHPVNVASFLLAGNYKFAVTVNRYCFFLKHVFEFANISTNAEVNDNQNKNCKRKVSECERFHLE